MTEEHKPIIVDEKIDITALVAALWAGRRLIVVITVTLTLIGILYALFATPFYRSTLSIYPAGSQQASMGQLQNLATTFGMSIGETEGTYNIPDVVKSRRIRKNILEQKWQTSKYEYPVDLIDYWEINKKRRLSLNPISWIRIILNKSDLSDEELARRWEEEGLEKLSNLISVSEDPNTALIRISTLMEEPQLAADITNYIAGAVADYIHSETVYEASRNRQFIEDRQNVIQDELENAENELRDFREQNRQIVVSPNLQLEEGRLLREVEIKQEVFITLQQQLELARIEEVRQTPVVHTLDPAEPAIEKALPKRKMIVILTFMMGLFIGVSLQLIKFQVNK